MVDLYDITRGALPRSIYEWIAISGIAWVNAVNEDTVREYIESQKWDVYMEGVQIAPESP